MSALASIFFDFNLPTAATWFYFSLLLAVALFFKFSRLLSVRNLDVLALFLLVPGLLLLQEGNGREPLRYARVAAELSAAPALPREGLQAAVVLGVATAPALAPLPYTFWVGYLWLLCGSAFFFLRCLLDLPLERRPALAPNLNLAGLAWLAGALFICLGVVAVRRPAEPSESLGKRSAAADATQKRAEELYQQGIASAADDRGSAAFWAQRTLALACHLAVVAGLVVIGARHFQDVHAGMAAATCYLLLPYTAYQVTQFHHVWPAAFLVWAVAAYRRPALAGALLGAAAGTAYFPVLVFPAWISFYWRRGAGRFCTAFVLTGALCLGAVGLLLWADNALPHSLRNALELSDWQPWRQPLPDTKGFWTEMKWAWAYRIPVSIAYLAFLITTIFWPYPKNLAQVLALSSALLIGIQFWYADQGGVYVLWYLPLLLLLVFRPNLSDRQPPAVEGTSYWAQRAYRRLRRLAALLLRPPRSTVPVR